MPLFWANGLIDWNWQTRTAETRSRHRGFRQGGHTLFRGVHIEYPVSNLVASCVPITVPPAALPSCDPHVPA